MVDDMIALNIFGDIEVVVTGDQVNRTSPKSKMRTLQCGRRDIVSEGGKVEEIWWTN